MCAIIRVMVSVSVGSRVVYYGAVTEADLEEWEADLSALLGRINPIFAAAPARGHAANYMRGLLSPLARKNGWTIAEHAGAREPKGLQRFLNMARWDVD